MWTGTRWRCHRGDCAVAAEARRHRDAVGVDPRRVARDLGRRATSRVKGQPATGKGTVYLPPQRDLDRIKWRDHNHRARCRRQQSRGTSLRTARSGRRPKPVWQHEAHDAETGGTNVLSALVGRNDFPFPKSLYAVEDALRFVVAPNLESARRGLLRRLRYYCARGHATEPAGRRAPAQHHRHQQRGVCEGREEAPCSSRLQARRRGMGGARHLRTHHKAAPGGGRDRSNADGRADPTGIKVRFVDEFPMA